VMDGLEVYHQRQIRSAPDPFSARSDQRQIRSAPD
jgi:hypothetical protein